MLLLFLRQPIGIGPFPLRDFCLLGVGNVLWVFRVVGLWRLADGAVTLARALAGA